MISPRYLPYISPISRYMWSRQHQPISLQVVEAAGDIGRYMGDIGEIWYQPTRRPSDARRAQSRVVCGSTRRRAYRRVRRRIGKGHAREASQRASSASISRHTWLG